MTITKLPETVTLNKTKGLKKAFDYFYDTEATQQEVFRSSSFDDKESKTHFGKVEDFVDTLESLGISKKTSIKNIGITLESWYEQLLKGAETFTEKPEYEKPTTTEPVEATTPDAIQLEQLEKESEKRIASQKEIYKRQQATLKESIENAQKIQEELKDKKIYAKVEIPKAPILSKQEQKDLNILKKSAKEPQKLVEELSPAIEEKITPSTKDLSPGERGVVADTIAVDIVEKLNYPVNQTPISTQTAINYAIHKQPKVIEVSDTATESVKNGSIALALHNSDNMEQVICQSILGKNLTYSIYGPSLSQFQVTLSNQQFEGYTHTTDMGQLNQNYIDLQTDQNSTLNTIQDLGEEKARGLIFEKTSTYTNSRIASLPTDSKIKTAYSIPEVRGILANYGLAEPVAWEATNTFGGLILEYSPESAPYISAIGRITGYGAGVQVVKQTSLFLATEGSITTAGITGYGASTITAIPSSIGATTTFFGTEAGTQVVTQATTQVAAKTGFAGLIAKVATFLGVGTGWATFGISTAIGLVVGKIAEKIDWTKVKKAMPYIAGFFVGVPVFIAGGPVAGAVAGIGTLGLLGGTAGLATAGAGFVGGIRFLAKNIIGPSIIAPIAITMLVLPVLVAFIMFVINSGAYIVPPTPATLRDVGKVISPYIGVQKEIVKVIDKNGTELSNYKEGVENESLPITAFYKVTITAKKGPLTNISISDKCVVRKENNPPSCPTSNPVIPSTIEDITPGTPGSFEFEMQFTTPSSMDTRTTNTITITADTPEQPSATAAGSASLKIGDPPEDCPADWPIYPDNEPYLEIYQGPHTSGGTHDVIEAIDIFSPDEPSNLAIIGNLVKATHQGTTVVGSGGNYGRYVDITSSCTTTNGSSVEVTSRYAHLSAVSSGVITGGSVEKDEVIGLAGSSGTAYPHLHYEFRPAPGPVPMDPPYLPVSIPDGCFNAGGNYCGVTY